MPPLDPQLRRRLENTVVAARGEAEAGARAALEALAVAHHEPYTHMKPEARALRNEETGWYALPGTSTADGMVGVTARTGFVR